MKRRKATTGAPEHLASFNESQWPGLNWETRFLAWTEAQDAHVEQHGWDGGPLDLVMRRSFVRTRYMGGRLHLGVSDHLGLPSERPRPKAPARRRAER